MINLPLPIIIGSVMIVAGLVLGIYVAIKAISRNNKGNDPLA